jgi:hypothetical protein
MVTKLIYYIALWRCTLHYYLYTMEPFVFKNLLDLIKENHFSLLGDCSQHELKHTMQTYTMDIQCTYDTQAQIRN